MVQAALVADERYTGQSLQEVANRITQSAMEDRKNGVPINKFYFEDAKWRSSGRYGINKAEREKLDNLEVNARLKQRLRERLQDS
jgi:hypothetical protein